MGYIQQGLWYNSAFHKVHKTEGATKWNANCFVNKQKEVSNNFVVPIFSYDIIPNIWRKHDTLPHSPFGEANEGQVQFIWLKLKDSKKWCHLMGFSLESPPLWTLKWLEKLAVHCQVLLTGQTNCSSGSNLGHGILPTNNVAKSLLKKSKIV